MLPLHLVFFDAATMFSSMLLIYIGARTVRLSLRAIVMWRRFSAPRRVTFSDDSWSVTDILAHHNDKAFCDISKFTTMPVPESPILIARASMTDLQRGDRCVRPAVCCVSAYAMCASSVVLVAVADPPLRPRHKANHAKAPTHHAQLGIRSSTFSFFPPKPPSIVRPTLGEHHQTPSREQKNSTPPALRARAWDLGDPPSFWICPLPFLKRCFACTLCSAFKGCLHWQPSSPSLYL